MLTMAACGGDDSTGGSGAAGPAGPAGATGATGAPGAAGESGTDGKPSDAPTILSMVPALVFPGRPVSVVVNGLGTDWQAATPPAVDLGAGVTVDSVEVTGPGTLLVSAHSAPTVDIGLRPVSVGGLAFGGFGVASALYLDNLDAPIRNGSVSYFRLSSQDPTRPLGLGPSLVTDAVQIFRDGTRVQDGVRFLSSAIYGPNELVGLMVVDGDAPAGGFDVNVITNLGSPPVLPPTVHYGTGAVQVEHVDATAAGAFPFVTPIDTKHVYNSTLFSFVAAADGDPTCTATVPPGTPPTITPAAIYANTGNRIGDARSYVAQGETVYVLGVLTSVDPAVTAPVDTSFTCTIAPFDVTNEAEPNDTTATGLPIVGAVAYHGTVAGTDRDVYTFASDGSVTATLKGSAAGDTLTMRFLDSAATEISKVVAAPSAAPGAVAVPAGAASIEIYADGALVPAQKGGTYELVFTP